MADRNKILYPEWAVIGAGPAGIAAVGQLIDNGVAGTDIVWIDPKFKVGDFGEFWSEVSSNTRVKLFTDFLLKCNSFNYKNRPNPFKIDDLPADETCKLKFMVEPLEYVTAQLQSQVKHINQYVAKINLSERLWHMTMNDESILSAKNVILATGATPRSMTPTNGVEIIDIYDALDSAKLAKKVNNNDRVAVFGSSHSAVILLRELLDLGIKEVVNFYQEPLRFAVPLDGFILFDDTGLKGNTAVWARKNLNGTLPKRLKRVISNDESVDQILPNCSKVIYAVGFNQRAPIISEYPNHKYNPYNGIIAPGLFGAGIGFPESKTDQYGNTELRVGLWKFINYLDKVIPLWLKYGT
jgi:cation diffusion facilitator CzcD-associated flavoprotein CzcO